MSASMLPHAPTQIAALDSDRAEALLDDVSEALRGVRTMEQAAQVMCTHLRTVLCDEHGEPACALVRFFQTVRVEGLGDALRRTAAERAGHALAERARCLVLLGTAGEEPAWNDTRRSERHRIIPMDSADTLRELKMLSQLFAQFGVHPDRFFETDEEVLATLEHASWNAFYVREARGSEYIVSQEAFVVPYGIASVVGFGGFLPHGEVYAVICFSKVKLEQGVADAFGALAAVARRPLMRFAADTFEPSPVV